MVAMINNSYKSSSHAGFLLFLLVLNLLVNLTSPRSILPPNQGEISRPPATPSAPAQNYTPSPGGLITPSKISEGKNIARSPFVVAGAFLLLFAKCFRTKRREESSAGGHGRPLTPAAVSRSELTMFDGSIKDMIVDEDGLDVLYWRKLKNPSGSQKERFDRASNGNGKRKMDTVPRDRSSSSHSQIHPGQGSDDRSSGVALQAVANSGGRPSIKFLSTLSSTAVSTQSSSPSPAPPAHAPPPPPAPEKKIPSIPPPPPPPVPVKKNTAPPPPPPPKLGAGGSSSKPPAAPKPPSGGSKTPEAVAKDDGGKDQVMLRPLHWEKLNINPDHSVVWDQIDRGSFQYNADMMEALFGVVPTNPKSPKEEKPKGKIGEPSNPNAKIFILDPRKSQNTAIVLKSLGIPRSELIDSLLEGKGLSVETLEKLARIVPTREEESQILGFDGDPAKLADAESSLYSLLNAVPSAFTRANAMLFRLNCNLEILNIKESLEMLESACNELRSSGIFLKLLEAILKAGNRLNAGTARGDAKGFNLATLPKLSDFRSSDGKTTLLHFVVREVIKNEGRRRLLSSSLGQQTETGSVRQAEDPAANEEEEKEFSKMGLPVVSGLSSEFSNVKKVASVDYDALKATLSSLTTRVDETRQLVAKCRTSGGGSGGFLKEMNDFLESAEMEIKAIQAEHTRVMDFVMRTTQYYQAGASYKNPLQLFIIVKDFLGMVDQTCAGIARSLQPKKPAIVAGAASGSPQPEMPRIRVALPKLPEHLLRDKSSTSSDSEDDS